MFQDDKNKQNFSQDSNLYKLHFPIKFQSSIFLMKILYVKYGNF